MCDVACGNPFSLPTRREFSIKSCLLIYTTASTIVGPNYNSVSNEAPARHLRDAQPLQQLGLRHAVAHAHLVYSTALTLTLRAMLQTPASLLSYLHAYLISRARADVLTSNLLADFVTYLRTSSLTYGLANLLTDLLTYSLACSLTYLLTIHLDALDRLDVIGQLLVLAHALVLPPTQAHPRIVPRWIGLLVRVVPGNGCSTLRGLARHMLVQAITLRRVNRVAVTKRYSLLRV